MPKNTSNNPMGFVGGQAPAVNPPAPARANIQVTDLIPRNNASVGHHAARVRKTPGADATSHQYNNAGVVELSTASAQARLDSLNAHGKARTGTPRHRRNGMRAQAIAQQDASDLENALTAYDRINKNEGQGRN